MTFLGKLFKLKPKLISLLAIGSSICGVSAIIAAKGAIDADDEDSSFAIAAILALGALALFTFPAIAHGLHMNDTSYGLWAGLGVDNTAEATAAGALYSDAAGKVAVLAKTARNAMIGFVVLAYAIYWAGKGQAEVVTNKAAFLWKKFPKFILGFLLISVLVGFHTFSKGTSRHSGKPVEVGIPADVRGCRPAHELSRDVEAGLASFHRWGAWRDSDCLPNTWTGDGGESDLGAVGRLFVEECRKILAHERTVRIRFASDMSNGQDL